MLRSIRRVLAVLAVPRLFTLSVPALLLVAGCSSTQDGGSPIVGQPSPTENTNAGDVSQPAPAPAPATPAVDNGAPSTNYPAPHPALPQLVNQAGGNVLSTPKLHLIYFPGYEHTARLEELAQKLGASTYWPAVTSEYGVGAVQYTGKTELTGETAPARISDTEIDTYLRGKLESGAFGTPDPNTVYTIVYPKSTSISSASGPLGEGKSCSSFGGYHNDTTATVGGTPQNFAYAVIPTCDAFGGLTEVDSLTGATSHEWVEAVTDPFPTTNGGRDSAYSGIDLDHFIWLLLGGTEASDLCVAEGNAFFNAPDVGFTVQRSWSNKLASQGHNPCAPDTTNTYFNSAPVLPDDVTLSLPASFGGQDVPTKGVSIPVGKSKTIEIDLFSDGPTSGPWAVSAVDGLANAGGGAATLDFLWDRKQGVNGEKLHLTITVKGKSTLLPGAHPFIITSALGQTKHHWPALVVE